MFSMKTTTKCTDHGTRISDGIIFAKWSRSDALSTIAVWVSLRAKSVQHNPSCLISKYIGFYRERENDNPDCKSGAIESRYCGSVEDDVDGSGIWVPGVSIRVTTRLIFLPSLLCVKNTLYDLEYKRNFVGHSNAESGSQKHWDPICGFADWKANHSSQYA